MAGFEDNSFEADVARIRAILLYNKVGSSLNNEIIKDMLTERIHEEERVDLVVLELEDSFGITLSDPTQIQSWQEFCNSPQDSKQNFSGEENFYTLGKSSLSQPEPSPNQDNVNMDIALDRETLLLRKEFTTLRYNELYIFLRAHRDEPDRLELARNYFVQERIRLESERSLSPSPPPRLLLNPQQGTSKDQVKIKPSDYCDSPVRSSRKVFRTEFGKENSVGVSGRSRFDTRVAPEVTCDETVSASQLLKSKDASLVNPGSVTAMGDNGNDFAWVTNVEDDNDPTFEADLLELTQILSNVPEDKLCDCLLKHWQQGDRIRRVINELLDNDGADVTFFTLQKASATNVGQPHEDDSPTNAKRAKKGPSSTEKRTAVNGVKPEEHGAVASSSNVSNSARPKVRKREGAASGSSTTVDNHKEAAGGVKRKHGKSSADTNPEAKNSTRAPYKGKALAEPTTSNLPLVSESNNTSIQPNNDGDNEEDEENLNDAKIERAITLYRLIIAKIPAIHALYAAHQAAVMVESGGYEEATTCQTPLENILKTGYPKFKDEWFVPKPEPGVETVANIDSLRRTLLIKVIEEQVANAVEMLPNIDPEYLEEKISALNGCEILVQHFVAGVLDNPASHPSIVKFQKRQRCSELAKKVWSAEDFLENYEDPIGYFYDPKRYLSLPGEMQDKYRSEVTLYLRKEFPYTYEREIQRAIREYWGNTVLMCNCLRNANLPRRKIKRPTAELTKAGSMTCPRLIEELNFLRVEQEIRAVVDEKQRARNQALALARQNNQLLECTICCENELIAMDFASCPDKHKFCKTCVRRHVEEIMGMVKCHFPCLDPSCNKEFQLVELQVVLKPQIFKRLMRRLQSEEIACANIDGLEMCPFCDFAAIPPEGDKVFQCLNPECSKQSCRLCQEEAHIPLSCQEFITTKKLDKIRTYMEDKMTEALLRECPRCRKKFVKSDGCNKIACPCGALSCYICRKEVKDYSHFDGQGANTGRCPLWTNTEVMHQQEIRAQAVKIMHELEQQNPGVKLDHVLPEIPPPFAAVRVCERPVDNPRPLPQYAQQTGNLEVALDRMQAALANLAAARQAHPWPANNPIPWLLNPVQPGRAGVAVGGAQPRPANNLMPRPQNQVQPGHVVQMGQGRARGDRARNGVAP